MSKQRHDIGKQKQMKATPKMNRDRLRYERAKRKSPKPLPPFGQWLDENPRSRAL